MDSKVDVPLCERSLNIVRRSRDDLAKILLSKYKCTITISDLGDGAAASPLPSWSKVIPEKRFEMTLDSGVVVSVWRADLTNFEVDAVVNAANDKLKHLGGLAFALSEAGGPQIQRDSENYVRAHGPVATGRAVMMDAGLLPCKKIIHAVGPHLSRNYSQTDLLNAEVLLSRAVSSVIDLVEKNGLRTVAIPAISSGIFNFPLDKCAETIVKALSFARNVKEIQLVNIDEPTVSAMEWACMQELEKHHHTRGAIRRVKANTKTTTTSSAHFGNVHVTVKRGLIEDEQTDVIVNTTSRKNWTGGLVSKAILQKAGYKMEKELKNASPDDLVINTKAFQLKCKQVYHILWPDIRHSDEFLQTLTFAVWQCLQMASVSQRSISFPAIGTGNQGLEKRDVCHCMLKAVTEFAAAQSKTLNVYFVIHPSQEDTFKVFEEETSRAQQMAQRENFLHGHGQRDDHDSVRVPSPHISLTCPSDEAQHEAKRWLSQFLSGSSTCVSICNNFILHLGEKEQAALGQIASGGVSVEESFESGQAKITVRGNFPEDVAGAALKVEAMLCAAVDEFVRQEEQQLSVSVGRLHFKRTIISPSDPEHLAAEESLRQTGLRTAKVESVCNLAMRQSFDFLQSQLAYPAAKKMFQCVPAHFCDVVCQVGFNTECAPPDDPAYGEGIYFAATVKKALEVWKLPNQEYVYIVEAEVLTGISTPGRRGLTVPPVLDTNPARRYDSVSAGPDVSIIFDSHQALPTKIITCKMREKVSPVAF